MLAESMIMELQLWKWRTKEQHERIERRSCLGNTQYTSIFLQASERYPPTLARNNKCLFPPTTLSFTGKAHPWTCRGQDCKQKVSVVGLIVLRNSGPSPMLGPVDGLTPAKPSTQPASQKPLTTTSVFRARRCQSHSTRHLL